MRERWKDIPGFENFYQVSDLGHVRSLDRKITNSSGHTVRYKGRLLVACSPSGKNNDDGRRMVILVKCGVRHSNQMVCNLVLQSFVGDCPDGFVCRHKDGDLSNNRLDNLEWSPPPDVLDNPKAYTGGNMQGWKISYSKMSDDKKQVLWDLHVLGYSTSEIAIIFRKSEKLVEYAINRRS